MLALPVPSWFDIESRLTHAMGYQSGASFRTAYNESVPSLAFNLRRLKCIRTAFIHAEWEAADLLRRRFADLDISSVLNDLIDAVAQMAMIVAGSVLTGAVIGAGVGVLGGGAGAIPLGATGAALGLQVAGGILSVLGLAALTEFFAEGLPAIAEYYLRGIRTAWGAPRGEEGLTAYSHDDSFAIYCASQEIAKGHVEAVILLLGAIVSYLTRGRGDAHALAQQMQASAKGKRLGAWILKHEEALKSRPELQTAKSHTGPYVPQQPAPVATPAKPRQPTVVKPGRMALHNVECFKADKLPVYKVGEFKRQLKGQEGGLNRLTIEEYLENIASPVKRSPEVAKRARKELESRLRKRFLKDFPDMDRKEAQTTAINKAKETMANIAALHNPDLRAGGKDIIGDFGDRQVNSTIGPQWRPKIKNLKEVAEKVPESLRKSTFLNVKLHKC
ncbi:DUF6861 domain-containing protein [Pseudomonas poae]|uniref:DUF6861 domain-containing protein n=1 Tax=Pseudomonas poae TaxID=200451 RepID=UPI0034D75A81